MSGQGDWEEMIYVLSSPSPKPKVQGLRLTLFSQDNIDSGSSSIESGSDTINSGSTPNSPVTRTLPQPKNSCSYN